MSIAIMVFRSAMVLSLVTGALTFKPQRIPKSRQLLTRLCSQSTSGDERSASIAIRLALLIDGDNAESGLVMQYVEEAGRYGDVSVRRIYADFSSDSMKGWKGPLNAAAFRTIHKYAYTTGKSSTDTALIIDAMDLLHSKSVNGFCIVSSDSDFTGLAVRIREEGYFVMGIGRKHTPEAFVKACEKFTYAEILIPTASSDATNGDAVEVQEPPKNIPFVISRSQSQQRKELKPEELEALRQAFQTVMNNDVDGSGHAMLSRISEQMRRNDPAFDPRNYGFNSFKRFCEASKPYFDVRFINKDKPTTMYLLEKQTPPPYIRPDDSDSEVVQTAK